MNTKVVKIDNDSIFFDNGLRLYSDHQQSCCEHHYLNIDEVKIEDFEEWLSKKFYDELLEKPSILDSSVVEEGFCIRKDTCNKPEIFKIKSKAFLLHEGHQLDKEVKDIEEEQNA